MENLRFNSHCSANVKVCNDSASAHIAAEQDPLVLHTHPPITPGQPHKLIVEGTGKIVIFLTQNPESFTRQTNITLLKETYDPHVYRLEFREAAHVRQSICTEGRPKGNTFVVSEENGENRRTIDLGNDDQKPWVLLLYVEGQISLISLVNEGSQKEDKLLFVDAEGKAEYFSADKSTFRRSIQHKAVCFGNRQMDKYEKVMLRVTRTEQHAVCEIALFSDQQFKGLTSTNVYVECQTLIKVFPDVCIRQNILHDLTTSQIVVTVPMTKAGWPVFMFYGCRLDLLSDIPGEEASHEASPIATNGTRNEAENPQLQNIQTQLNSIELRLSKKEEDDKACQKYIMDQIEVGHRISERQFASLSQLHDEQRDVLTHVKDTRTTVERTSNQVKGIVAKLNKSAREKKTTFDKSLELLAIYINPNYVRIKKSLNEKEFTDFLLQYDVITQQQQEDISNREGGDRRRDALLDILRRKPTIYLPEVRAALEKSGNKDLLRYFQ
ncbi:uncharacterized protein [Argopecten irradians]|uniref:uncharacterized protein n=1 Tax=Argopecten irradians TaxID=31199 RepID=UPI0037154AC3